MFRKRGEVLLSWPHSSERILRPSEADRVRSSLVHGLRCAPPVATIPGPFGATEGSQLWVRIRLQSPGNVRAPVTLQPSATADRSVDGRLDPALKGRNNSAQGNALVVLHKLRSGAGAFPAEATTLGPKGPDCRPERAE